MLVGTNSIHTKNFYFLIKDYFDDILIITDNQFIELPDVHQETLNFSLKNPLKINGTIQKLRAIIVEYNPEIIHVQQIGSHAWLTVKALNELDNQIVMTAWGSDILLAPKRNFILKNILTSALKKASAITCDSFYIANQISTLVHAPKFSISVANWGITEQNHNNFQKKKIIYSNRLHKPLYCIDSIINSFHKFLTTTNGNEWKLIIAGNGEQTNMLKATCRKLNIENIVEFVGWVDQNTNIEYYKEAMYFVSVPQSDGTSISLLEAMYYGAIPIVSNLPSNLEWINHLVNGFVVTNPLDDFISPALNINWEEASDFNRRIIAKRGTKAVNRTIFTELYQNLQKKTL